MKKIFLLFLLSCFVTSCMLIPYQQKAYIGDFSKYTDNGFTISTSTSGFEYKSLGVIGIEFYPGYMKGYKKEADKNADPFYGSPASTKYYHPDWDYRLSELVKVAKSMGANGILDVKMATIPATQKERGYYLVYGLAVTVNK